MMLIFLNKVCQNNKVKGTTSYKTKCLKATPWDAVTSERSIGMKLDQPQK